MQPSNIVDKRVIISPLDWGMGHTTRCIPIIQQLIENKNQVLFAGNSKQISLISKDFPKLKTIIFEGYNIKLDSNKSTYLQIISQSAKMKKAIRGEYKRLEELLQKNPVDVIISDNRYGFYSNSCINIILTHQLNLPVPIFKKVSNKIVHGYINKFDYCWIPDSEVNPLSGNLSDGKIEIPKIFIGILSRFKKNVQLPKFKYLGIISGPEPERSRFAKKMTSFLQLQNENCVIAGVEKVDESNIAFCHNPSTDEMEKLIHQSEIIISRAGFTTIMELFSIDKSAVLIPTKGQYEQEYLAKTISKLNFQFKTEKEFFI